jgi:hypothetical protein
MQSSASSLGVSGTSAGSVWPDNPRRRTAETPGAQMSVPDRKATEEQSAGPLGPPKAAPLNLLIRNNCLGELDRWGQQGLRFGKIHPAPTSP